MITKSYSIMCDVCTNSEQLFSSNLKDCKEEAERMGWKQSKNEWHCEKCREEKE